MTDPTPAPDYLIGAVHHLAAAAMFEGADRDQVEQSLREAIEQLPESSEEIHEEYPERAEAVAPYMVEAIEEMRKCERRRQ